MSGSPSLQRLTVSFLGAAGSLALHLLLVAPAFWASAASVQHPQDEGGGSINRPTPDDVAILVTFLDDPPMMAGSAPHATPSIMPSPRTLLLPVSMADIPLPPVVDLSNNVIDENASPVAAAGETAPGRALMFGRYVGQITARIERAWIRPRTPLPSPAERFECRARIEQDKGGAVRLVELEQCTVATRWQLSLMQAIQSASPIPAPPDPSVFSRTLRIQFTAEPFSPNASTEGFESEPRTAMQ